MKTSIPLLLVVITFASVAVAQNHKDKVEAGVHSTSLTLFHPDVQGDETQAGFGGRVTYNFNRWFAAEAEINFFPQKQIFLSADGNAIQAQFGAKIGKRFEKFGIFAKVRPGFLSVDRTVTIPVGPVDPNSDIPFKIDRKAFFTMDFGGVLEFYPSKRTVVRFDAGDTVIRHPQKVDLVISFPSFGVVRRPAKFNHNFQFTAGVAFRLGDFPVEDDNVGTSANDRKETPRFEVGAQFTSLSVDPPSTICAFCVSVTDQRIHTEPGVGGRFTFNITDNIAVEAEGNYYTRDRSFLPDPSGHMYQGQFGVKVGKRFENWGLFGKARPGFVGFTEVAELISTRIQFFGTFPVVLGDFRTVRQHYPTLDVGGVVEFYISRRWMARFDVGDTIIRYGALQTNGFSVANPVITRSAETHHNFQVTSGIGFRF